ncbi:MAG: ABC transporter ATP-binding protein [Candidatus Blackburnbacteria bacterium]|nr:ABC transporter ATP-binding protein [Candidatus Blackburnbacteria bacterium]
MLKIFSRYYSFIFRYRWQFAAFFTVVVFANITSSIQPYFYKLFVDALPQTNYKQLLNILLSYFGLRFGELMLSVLAWYLSFFVVIYASRDARVAVVKKIQELDFAYHLTRSTGSLISAIKRGDGAFLSIFQEVNLQLAGVAVQFLVLLAFFFSIRLEIGVLMLISFSVALVAARFLIQRNIRTRREFNDREDDVSAVIVDNMINFETVKLFGKEEREIKRLKSVFLPWEKAYWGYSNSFRQIDLIIGTIANTFLFFIMLLALVKVARLTLSVGEYVLILGFVTQFYGKFFDLVYEFRNVARHYSDLETYFSILDKETLVKDPEKPVELEKAKGEIEFRNVTFTYPEAKKPSLENFNLKIRQGESVAFVGKSGVGKTTIVKLLMRFYDVDAGDGGGDNVNSGEILLDGIAIRNFTKTNLRSFIGVVPQEPVLFNDTLGFNIAYGADNATKKEIDVAAKMANLDEFIRNLPKKYETLVGERGVKLSGGQRQRLAIARMILANPDIIIFDEATSQLDSESERLIQDAFWEAAKGKTTIVIAHRLSTVVRADKIVVMEEGRIKETGSHRALVSKNNGLYKKFWNLQVEAFD